MNIKLSSNVYDPLKKFAMVWLPALGTLYFAVAGIWHLPAAEQVIGTITAVDTFLGVVLHISSQNYNNSDEKYDGTFKIEPNEDGGSALRLKNVNMAALASKNEVTFKIESPSTP